MKNHFGQHEHHYRAHPRSPGVEKPNTPTVPWLPSSFTSPCLSSVKPRLLVHSALSTFYGSGWGVEMVDPRHRTCGSGSVENAGW